MATMNYCLTVCRAAEENVQRKSRQSSATTDDIPNSSSPSNGAYFFGRFFSFGSTPPTLASPIDNSFLMKVADTNDNM